MDPVIITALYMRPKWTRKLDFLFGYIGLAVGLGNFWRFPYLCYRNGGGAFLVPYVIFVVILGLPLSFMEVAIGQYTASGCITSWNICPMFKGLGIATAYRVFVSSIIYSTLISWAIYYLFSSFSKTLPWSHCNNTWNTDLCGEFHNAINMSSGNEVYRAGGEINGSIMSNASNIPMKYSDPTEEYWERKVLGLSNGIEDIGSVKWDLALCLLLAWVIIYACVWKGIKSSGVVAYFTVSIPYLLLLILLVRGVTLPGSLQGIKFYVIPEWRKLAQSQTWIDAAMQVIYTNSIGAGMMVVLGSHNEFHHNSWRDTKITCCVNSATSILAGFVVFSVLGFMAHQQGVSVATVADSGPGLAFIAYPKALANMPASPFWSSIFFIMLIMLGLDTMFPHVEAFVTAIMDALPREKRREKLGFVLTTSCCAACFILGLSLVTQGGMYILQILDFYVIGLFFFPLSFLQCIAVSWIYGVNRFYGNIEKMLGFHLTPYLKINWLVLGPLCLAILSGFIIYDYSELTYSRTYHNPQWAIITGWILGSVALFILFIYIIIQVCYSSGSLKSRLMKIIEPNLSERQMQHAEIEMIDTTTTSI